MANLEEGARISGFHNISTLRAPRFTEKFLAELEIILQKVYGRPVVAALEQFKKDLPDHLYNSPKAHDLSQLITDNKDTLITHLYIQYRESGYTGTVEDMLIAIDKFVELATDRDVILGYSETKAINPPQWRQIFGVHQARRAAHGDRFKPFTDLKIFPKDVGFHFDYVFPENYLIYEDDYTPSCWNTSGGTFHCEFTYNYPLTPNEDGYPLCELSGIGESATLYTTAEKVILKIDATTSYQLELPFSQTPDGIEKLIFVYTKDKIILRDQMGTSEIETEGSFLNTPPVSFTILQPLRQVGSPISVREVSYYPAAASEIEQVFFLN